MALPDIKDAGILAGFVRWGWPYHGLCEGGVIGDSGKTIAQPGRSDAWLIDKDLPELDISPELAASELTDGREWRNYALIPGRTVHGTPLPENSYIHTDADDANWLVTVSGSFPSTNTARITLSIVRFGHFEQGIGAQTPITMYQDVACEEIELSNPAGGPFYGRGIDLYDVWTNGARALACVFIYMDESESKIALFSAIEITLSGSGGTTGSTLVMDATEVKGQSELTTNGAYDGTNSIGNYDAISSGSATGGIVYDPDAPLTWGTSDVNILDAFVGTADIVWNQGTIGTGEGGYGVLRGYVKTRTECRICQYDSTGNVIALRLKYSYTIDHWFDSVTPGSLHFSPNTSYEDSQYTNGVVCLAYVSAAISIVGEERIGFYLLQNDTVIDKVEQVTTMSGSQQFYYGPDPTDSENYPPSLETSSCSIERHTDTVYDIGTPTWNGEITEALSPDISISPVATSMFSSWQIADLVNSGFSYFDDGITKFGIHRTDNVAAFFLLDTSRTYGTIATPLGNKTSAETGSLYFAWQRKTGDFSFSANPICYV